MVHKHGIARTGVTIIQYALVSILVSAMAFGLMPVFQKAYKSMEMNKAQHNKGNLNREGSFASWYKPGGGEKGVLPTDPGGGLGPATEDNFNFKCNTSLLVAEEVECGGIPGACGLLKDGCWICNHDIDMWQWETDPQACNDYWYTDWEGTCSASCINALNPGYFSPFSGPGTGADAGYCYVCADSGISGYWYLESDANVCDSFWNPPPPPDKACFGSDDTYESPCGTCVGLPPLPGYYLEKNGIVQSCWICQGNQWINTTDRNTCIETWVNVSESGSVCPSYTPGEALDNQDYPYCGCKGAPPARGPSTPGPGRCWVCNGGTWLREANEQNCTDFWKNDICKIVDEKKPPSCNGSTEPSGNPAAGNCWLCTNPYEDYRENPLEGNPLYDIYDKPCNVYWVEEDYPAFLNIPGDPDNLNTVCSEPFSSLGPAEAGISIDPVSHKWGCWACSDQTWEPRGSINVTNFKIWKRIEWEGSKFSPWTSGSQNDCSGDPTACPGNEICGDHKRCVDSDKYLKYMACNYFWMKGMYPPTVTVFPDPENGVAYARGSAEHGKLGVGTLYGGADKANTLSIVKNSIFKQVSAGYNHSCGIDYKNRAWCWGNNQYGQLGNTSAGTSSKLPVLVSTNILFKEISARGEYHTCGIDINDEAWCWGRNNVNQLGLNAAGGTYSSPQRVIGSHRFKDISAGKNHACAIDTSGGAWCWGGEVSGVLGSGNAYFPSGSNPPLQARTITRVAGGHNFVEISTSTDHTCAIDLQGKVWCWGNNYRADTNSGSMKLGVYMASYLPYPSAPIQIPSSSSNNSSSITFSAITTGDKHTCALESSGRAWCWGNNSYKQIGTTSSPNSSISDAFFPIPIGEGLTFSQIDSLGDHTCAVTPAGKLYCWGDNSKSQSKDDSYSTPVPTLESVRHELTFKQVSAGANHTLVVSGKDLPKPLRPIGKLKVVAWGNNNYGQLGDNTKNSRRAPVPVTTGNYNFVKVVAGKNHSCGLTSTGKVYCWGDNKLIPTEISGLSDVSNIYAGYDRTCVRTRDEYEAITCWGGNAYGQLGVGSKNTPILTPTIIPIMFAVNDVAMGEMHTCSTNTMETLCWGQNSYGQLGIGGSISELLNPDPSARVMRDVEFVKIVAGNNHTCSLGINGEIWCWGRNTYGQLGDPYTSETQYPHKVSSDVLCDISSTCAPNGAYVDISSGDNHICALDSSGTAWCWGDNSSGMLGNNIPSLSRVPIKVLGEHVFKQISLGGQFSCGIDDKGKAWCWGDNYKGQLGDNSTNDSYIPVPIAGDYYFESIACGEEHCAALVWDTSGGSVAPAETPPLPKMPSGPAYGWGYNEYGQIGDGTFGAANIRPSPVPLNKTFFDVSAGAYHACGLDTNGKAWCWGRNMYGEIGMNPVNSYKTTSSSPIEYYPTPIEVANQKNNVFKKISSGVNHTCAIDTAGKAWCWGYNEFGQLGIGYKDDYNLHYMPEAVSGDIVFTDIAVGNQHTCAISASGVVGCWGNNSLGQLGLSGHVPIANVYDTQTTPFAIGGNAIQISSSNNHTCVIDTVGDAYCWGDNADGQIGMGTVGGLIPTPSLVRKNTAYCAGNVLCSIDKPFIQISAGVHHTCAIDITGTAWCWGRNRFGEVGTDTRGVIDIPREVPGGHKFKEIHAGEHVTCGITTSGEGYCWGYDGHGELGSSQPHSADSSATPLKVDGGPYITIKPAVGGGNHSIAIADPSATPPVNNAGFAFGWGDNISYTLGVNATTNSVLYPRQVVNNIEFVQVSASQNSQSPYYCGIDKNGQAWCWGWNDSGQLGNNSTTESIVPVKVAGAHKFQQISTGYNHTCAIDKDEQAWCWGDNSSSQLGHNIDDTQKLIPVKVTGSHKFKKITTGFDFTCALDREGKAWCWGTSSSGQLGGELEPGAVRKTPSLVSSNYLFKDIDAGNYFVCGIATDGAAYCWGDNGSRQLGSFFYGLSPIPPYSGTIGSLIDLANNPANITTSYANTPIGVMSSIVITGNTYQFTFNFLPYAQISAGGNTACALDPDGTAYCWGYNSHYQTGDVFNSSQGTKDRPIPIKVNTNEKFKSIEVGAYHTCGITKGSGSIAENTTLCWGNNSSGQLGINVSGEPRQVPTAVVSVSSSPNKFRQISLGANSSLGLSFVKSGSTPTIPDQEKGAEGASYGWGDNADGQIGDGTTNTPRELPVKLDVPEDAPAFKQVEAGMQHSCAIDNHDSIWCWGHNSLGGVNGQTGPPIPSPTLVFPSKKWKQVAVGLYHTCAIEKNTNNIYCWGTNNHGALGLGYQGSAPAGLNELPGQGQYKQISAGYYTTCALDMGGQAWCWGYNSLGQVGDNSSGNLRTSPVKVWGDHTFTSISLKGGEFACALDISGQAWCWGRDDMGQLGDNQDGSSLIYFPVKVVGNHTFSQVSAGIYHACALDTAGKAWCWGNGADGQLGNGSVDRKYIPTPVSNDYYKTISAGGHHTCALDFSGRAVCWGNNEDGQLGDGSGNSQSNVPVFVNVSSLPGSTFFEHISAGGSHTIAVSRNKEKPEESTPPPPGHWLEGNTKIYQYGGMGNESGYALAESGDYIYIAGNESSDTGLGSSSSDIVVLKISKSDGTVIWKKQMGGAADEVASAIKVGPGGSVYITGYETSTTAGGLHDIVVIKLDANGNVLWKKEFGGSGREYGNAIDVTSDGLHVYVTGQEMSAPGGGQQDIVVMKLEAATGTIGTTGWIKQFGGTARDVGEGIAIGSDGIYIIGHQTSNHPENGTDAFVMKIDVDGGVIWKKQYGGTGEERALALFVSDISLYVTGYTTSETAGEEDIFVMQLDYDTGAVKWKAHYGGTGSESGLGIAVFGNYIYVVGEQSSDTKGLHDLFAMALDVPDGEVVWKNRAGGATNDHGYDIIVGTDSMLYITGSESSESAGGGTSSDILLMKVNKTQGTSSLSWTADGVEISNWNMLGTNIGSDWIINGSDISTGWTTGDWSGTVQNITTGWTMEGTKITPVNNTTTGKWVK